MLKGHETGLFPYAVNRHFIITDDSQFSRLTARYKQRSGVIDNIAQLVATPRISA